MSSHWRRVQSTFLPVPYPIVNRACIVPAAKLAAKLESHANRQQLPRVVRDFKIRAKLRKASPSKVVFTLNESSFGKLNHSERVLR